MAIVDNKQICDNGSGIVSIRRNEIDYTFWTYDDVVRPYIKKFLKEKFPGKLVVDELNKIDLSVPEENLPIEIQTTSCVGNVVHYSDWESSIRTQIDKNMAGCNRCWFFFDSDLLRSMKQASRGMSINMDWFRKYMKEEKLKVFTVSYDGVINELEYKDFDFLSKVSQTCSISAETDDIILDRNKMMIFTRVTRGYKFTQDEIDTYRDDWTKNGNGKTFNDFLLGKRQNSRENLYGHVLKAIGDLPSINDVLSCRPNKKHYNRQGSLAKILGIFDIKGINNATIKFVDRFDICKYFPAYLRSKDIWSKLRGRVLNSRQFHNVTTGKSDVVNGIDYYWGVKQEKIGHEVIDTIVESKDQIMFDGQVYNDNDNEVNFEIKSKDQIITLNIRKTKQVGIDDAWK